MAAGSASIDFAVAVPAIPLESLLGDLDPAECKLHCAVWNREEQPIDVLARSWEVWVGWNSWRPSRDEFNRRFIFSLAQMVYDHPSHWLFGGVFEVVGRRTEPRARSYDVELREDFLGAYIKRLKVGFTHPGRSIRLNMENHLSKMEGSRSCRSPTPASRFLDSIGSTTRLVSLRLSLHSDARTGTTRSSP